jgi:hypothetical protein
MSEEISLKAKPIRELSLFLLTLQKKKLKKVDEWFSIQQRMANRAIRNNKHIHEQANDHSLSDPENPYMGGFLFRRRYNVYKLYG